MNTLRKAGIIKSGIPLILYSQSNEIMETIIKVAKEKNSKVIVNDLSKIDILENNISGQVINYKNFKNLKINFINNVIVFLSTLVSLLYNYSEKGFYISETKEDIDMYNLDKLEKILKEKVISLEETSYGITNKNYIIITDNNKYFYRTSKDSTNIVNKDNEREAINLLANENYFLKPIFFNNDNLITEFQPNPKTFISQRKLSTIIRIGKLLNNFHSKKFQAEHIFDPIKQFYNYYNQIDEKKNILDQYLYIIDEFRKFYEPDRLCHNDLVEGNFLFSRDKLYLIDFEYAGFNDYYFDIASFISENDLNYEETITFLKAYFSNEECNYKKLDVFLQFCDLLWYTWAILLYEKRREEIYNEIAQAKLHRLINPRKIVY